MLAFDGKCGSVPSIKGSKDALGPQPSREGCGEYALLHQRKMPNEIGDVMGHTEGKNLMFPYLSQPRSALTSWVEKRMEDWGPTGHAHSYSYTQMLSAAPCLPAWQMGPSLFQR